VASASPASDNYCGVGCSLALKGRPFAQSLRPASVAEWCCAAGAASAWPAGSCACRCLAAVQCCCRLLPSHSFGGLLESVYQLHQSQVLWQAGSRGWLTTHRRVVLHSSGTSEWARVLLVCSAARQPRRPCTCKAQRSLGTALRTVGPDTTGTYPGTYHPGSVTTALSGRRVRPDACPSAPRHLSAAKRRPLESRR
jgi:hypothetical protein